MALRKIVVQGDECLTKVCRPVTEFNPHLHQLLDDMTGDTGGRQRRRAGGSPGRECCAGCAWCWTRTLRSIIELVNPEIVAQSGEQTGLEGCLSVPGKWGIVTRPDVVRVRAQDRYGDWFEVEGEGLTARAFCHEIEHLDGHLFVEHIDHFLSDEELRDYLEQEEREAREAAEAQEGE